MHLISKSLGYPVSFPRQFRESSSAFRWLHPPHVVFQVKLGMTVGWHIGGICSCWKHHITRPDCCWVTIGKDLWRQSHSAYLLLRHERPINFPWLLHIAYFRLRFLLHSYAQVWSFSSRLHRCFSLQKLYNKANALINGRLKQISNSNFIWKNFNKSTIGFDLAP